MPVACPSCGTQNPDGNNFCQNCGRQLTAAPAPPPPAPGPAAPPPMPAYAPAPAPSPAAAPIPPPPTYQSPYYQPAQPVPVNRTPVGLIVGVVVALLVLMGGCGVAVAAVVAHPKPSPVAHVSPVPTTAPSAVPTAVPTAAPTPRPTQVPPSGSTVSTKTWSASASGFKVLKQDDNSADLQAPDGDGTIFIQSGSLQQQTNTQDYIASVLTSIGKKYPDASICLKPKAESHGGQDGIITGACYTYAPQNAQAFKAADVFWVSVSSSNVLYVYEVFTEEQNFDHVYNQECLPVINSISWKD